VKIDNLYNEKEVQGNLNQNKFETITCTISSRFVWDGDINEKINNSLRDICILTDSCRVYAIFFNHEKTIKKRIYEWCNEGIEPHYGVEQNFNKRKYSWWMKTLEKEQIIFIQNVSKMSKNAFYEKKMLEEKDVKSLLVYPLFLNSLLSGFIGIDDTTGNKEWTDLEFSLLRFISQVIGTVLERNETEKKLKKSEAEYRQIIENLNEGYFELDLKGNFIYFNKALSKKLGYSKNELIEKRYQDVLDKGGENKLITVYEEVIESGIPKLNNEFRVKRKDGMFLTFQSSMYLRYDSEGNVIGLYGLARDITERKKNELLKEKFHEKLEQQVESRTKELNQLLEKQKKYQDQILKASNFKSEFLATMSHELRTPLNAIIGFTELLLEESFGELNTQQKEYLTDIKTSALHQYDMISNILDITKIESGKVSLNMKYFSLNVIIDQISSTIRPLYRKKGLHFILKGLDNEEEIYADPIRFKEISLNLLTNAIKFTESGKITLIFKQKYDKWIFKVRDTGIGISLDDYDIIFKEFKRVNSTYVRSTSGTGLGLSLTKRLVELHNGEISFVSLLGVGTTFTFYIPKNINVDDFDYLI